MPDGEFIYMPRKYKPRPPVERNCLWCGTLFTAKSNAKYCPRPALCREHRYRAKAAQQNIAHTLVAKAIKLGELVRPETCENCGLTQYGAPINAHHDDYSKPLEVRWLCVSCHQQLHRGNMTPGVRTYSY